MRKKHKIMYEDKEYYGGGVILYHGKKVLLQKVSNKKYWEDFGGRTDKEDPHIIETAFREASEESNGIITKELLEDLIKRNKRKCYKIAQDNTYFVYLIYVPKRMKGEMTKESFGEREPHDGITRFVEWVEKSVHFHPRLRKGQVFFNF